MTFLSSRRWALHEMFRGLSADKGLFSLAIVLSALALSIPLFISSIFYKISEPMRQLPTSIEITVFTDQNANANRVAKEINDLSGIENIQIISKETALDSLNQRFGLKDKTANTQNPLPDIVIVTISSSMTSSEIDKIGDKIEKVRGVDMIAYETSWRDKLQALSRAGQIGILSLGLIVALLVILVLAAAIRMTTLSAKHQMRALYVFGASPSFAIRPWAWRGFVLMLASSLGALGITKAGILLLNPAVASAANLYGIQLTLSLPTVSWCCGFVIICCLIGYIVAVLAAQDSWYRARL